MNFFSRAYSSNFGWHTQAAFDKKIRQDERAIAPTREHSLSVRPSHQTFFCRAAFYIDTDLERGRLCYPPDRAKTLTRRISGSRLKLATACGFLAGANSRSSRSMSC
jgi:hypothetical protein